MAKLWNMTKEANGSGKLNDIDLDGFRIKSPTVIFLTGIFTDDDHTEHTAGAIDRLEEIIENRPSSTPAVDVYSWSHDPGLKNIFDLASYNFRPDGAPSKASKKLCDKVLMPLLLDPAGKPLPEDEVRKNLRNVTFFGYSAGSITAQDCFNATLRRMTDAGYDKDKARDILHEVVLVSVGTMSRPSQEKNRFTTVYLTATNDKLSLANRRLWNPLRAVFKKVSRKLRVRKMSPTSALISARVGRTPEETRKRGEKTWREYIEPLLPRWTMFHSNHELPRYITHDDGVSPFSKIVLYSIANAVARTGRIDPVDLLKAPEGVSAEQAKAFNDKIKNALQP